MRQTIKAAERPLDVYKRQVVTTALDAQGVPVEYTVSHYRGDKVKFSVELYR